MKKSVILLSATLLAFSCGSTQEKQTTAKTPEPANPIEYGNTITSAELKEMLYIYASDEFEGRLTGAKGQKMAVEYLKQQYINMDVKAAKADGNYFQDVPLEIMEAPKVNFTVNGKTFTMVDDYVSASSSKNGSVSVNEIVFADYGIDDEKYDSYASLDVKGKVVLIRSGEPKSADGNYVISGTDESSSWSNFRQEYSAKRDAAEKRGAAAVLFYYPEVYEMASKRFGGSNGRMSLKGEGESMYYFLINTDLAKAIMPSIETATKSKTISVPMNMEYVNSANEFMSENVAAFIKGSEKPDEIIVISAHLDHEGIKDGEIYNGADDDGSGTVAIVEIAEAFKTAVKNGHRPKRSILFLHVTGEEKGLLGSQYYTDMEPLFPLANTVANLNIDMIGRTDPKRTGADNYIYLIGSDKLSTELHNISEEMNETYMNIELDYTFNDDNDPNRFYYRSDHYNFAKNNIPVIFYFNGTHDDYHQPSDTPDKIRYDLLENRTRLVFYTAWELANRENRIKVDKAVK
ncbi:M28 family peptidase [Bizionia myxarmorum]|uniref:M28 family peptidase n=1 Tax=Bizionia myxarmorum TaxID=291186 RepID=A0A5D0R0W0_9FLAO|nr:M28 family peptidase [Bizionia myxarmorum]TYB74318.1 M28 family peptidase [Bizionia myxarmorum]